MMLEIAIVSVFTLGWLAVFAFRTEALSETLPALTSSERWVSYGMIAANSVNMTLGCLLITSAQVSLTTAVLGVIVYALGIGLWFWGRSQICPMQTRRRPNQPPLRLRRDGAIGLVRHPLYGGMLLASAAPLVVSRSPVVGLTYVLWITVMVSRMVQEERVLRQQLGAEYESYQREVGRIIPFVW